MKVSIHSVMFSEIARRILNDLAQTNGGSIEGHMPSLFAVEERLKTLAKRGIIALNSDFREIIDRRIAEVRNCEMGCP